MAHKCVITQVPQLKIIASFASFHKHTKCLVTKVPKHQLSGSTGSETPKNVTSEKSIKF